jgi:2,3-bisphosphoglycerate-independent phosphoglycerate mutase
LLGTLLKGINEPCTIAILPDHPTPTKIGTHTRDPVPFSISSPLLKPDGVKVFDEVSAQKGGFGLVKNDYLISLLISSGKKTPQ